MIDDFKAIGNPFNLDFDIKLEKNQQVYCFIGENGVGKTKLLQTMAKSSFSNHQLFKNIASYQDVVPLVKVKVQASYGRMQKDLPSNLQQVNQAANQPIIFISAKNRGYIGGLNNTNTINLPPNKNQQLVNELLNTLNSIYDEDINLDSVTNWLLQRIMINRNIRGTEKYYTEALFVLECLNKISPEMNWLKVNSQDNNLQDNFAYEDGKFLVNDIPIESLSTGYASILRIIQEVVAGLCAWSSNEQLSNLQQQSGIVFIDEIDLHLHPKWQFKIIDLLKEFFPKVVFYITTHSPLVLFNLKNGEGYKLHKDMQNLVTAQKIEQNNMQFIGDIIKNFFEVENISLRKTDKQTMLDARKILLDFIEHNQDE